MSILTSKSINNISRYRYHLYIQYTDNNIYQYSYVQNIDKLKTRDNNNIYMSDAGFDLFCTEKIKIQGDSIGNKINLQLKASMYFVKYNIDNEIVEKIPCGYFLYPRSSMGSKTPLRLSNSIGVIDSGYRGNLCILLDNLSKDDYTIKRGDRLVQICAPNITYPLEVFEILDISELGITQRGNNGFGSTG